LANDGPERQLLNGLPVHGSLAGAPVTIGEAMEKLDAAETGYNVTKKTASDLNRACLVVQHAHHYFTQVLKISDDVRGTATGRVFVAALGGGGGINEMTKKIQYGDAVKMANKAQICLNEMFRVMKPYGNMLPADRMADYTSLNKIGLMQMSKIYNLMWGGSITDHGVAGQSILRISWTGSCLICIVQTLHHCRFHQADVGTTRNGFRLLDTFGCVDPE